jgi:hypothetical protein
LVSWFLRIDQLSDTMSGGMCRPEAAIIDHPYLFRYMTLVRTWEPMVSNGGGAEQETG